MNRIRELRKSRQLSQSALGAHIGGVSQQMVAEYETGTTRLSLSLAQQLADFFGVSVSYLMGETSAENEKKTLTNEQIVAINRRLRHQIAESGKVLTDEQEDLLLTVMLDFAADHPNATAAELAAALTGSLQVTAAAQTSAAPRKAKKQ